MSYNHLSAAVDFSFVVMDRVIVWTRNINLIGLITLSVLPIMRTMGKILQKLEHNIFGHTVIYKNLM